MKPYIKLTLTYAAFGALWIFLSDRVAMWIAGSVSELAYFQMMKGWLFVALSTFLLLVISRRAFVEQRRVEQEKLAIFHKTVEGSYHILLNYLNQMQLVSLEAEQCADFDRDVLRQCEKATEDAHRELKKLGEIQNVTAEHIDEVIYEKIRGGRGRSPQ